MIIREFKGERPVIGEGCFIAETAAVIGKLRMGRDCSVWYGACIRADENSIEIGDRVNVQDCSVIHVSEGEGGQVRIGNDVTIGHNATVHACTVGSNCLIGMGATVLDGAVIGDGAIVAAGALVLGKTVVGPNELWAGVPAKFVKTLTPEAVEKTISRGVRHYVEMAKEYLGSEQPAD